MRPRAPWAIVDFPGADGRPVRQVFRDPVAVITTNHVADVLAALDEVESLAAMGRHLVGFVAYDAAPAFEPRFRIHRGWSGPLLWFAAFDDAVESAPRSAPADGPLERWESRVDQAAYRRAVIEIIEGIGRGDFYQVNLTERFRSVISNPLAVYERLRLVQRTGYFAFIETGDLTVISVSPELFVRRSGSMIESRPMKGTAPRGRWSAEDDALAAGLATSEKDRAENVMIVDLVRNDMGRIAIPGTVQVPATFSVEKYPTVLQMTSHVKSEVTDNTSLGQIFTALFPCGSVTGAPKIAASKSIESREATPRGIYCGAVGVVRPNRDFVFNVAIRTAVVAADGEAVYGAGGGITADSHPDQELAELFTKAAVLSARPETFDLIETMRIDEGLVVRLDRHLARLSDSARYFDFESPEATVASARSEVLAAARGRPRGVYRLRLVVGRDGTNAVTVDPFQPAAEPRRLGLARTPVDSRDRQLYHKTSDRDRYTGRLAELAGTGVDDVILINERGEITETSIGNLVLEIDGALVTPALDSGLLPGILRGELLAEGRIAERVLRPADLEQCTRLWMINSLRGWVPAAVVR
jgi:para-aminobenzoate synthetase/4-amino-4-deoxychorismate lyase